MNMIWVVILGFAAGPGDRPAAPAASSRAPAAVAATRPSPAGSVLVARRAGRRPCPGPWISAGLDECDPPEVEEDGFLLLGLLGSDPGAWSAWSRPVSSTAPGRPARPDPPPPAPLHLRC